MPVYDYHCDACGHTFEVFHGVDERPEVRCDRCGQPARKLFRPVPIIFKGSGWHITDYGRGSQPKQTEGEKGGKNERESAEKGDEG